ncbi:MAG: YihA family ribosome biogenesis GTP-binding protein, partial [Betaproteobacteria bacterium]|nr:YihA family ribosome biogenesis GTP-binding protein [Betaproteobacteria bacterium]
GYLAGRKSLAGVVLLMDARHPLTKLDRNFLEWLRPVPVPRLVLLSKSDKLSRAARLKMLAATRAALDAAALSSQVVLFSSSSGEGVEEARSILGRWLRQIPRAGTGHKKPPEKGN